MKRFIIPSALLCLLFAFQIVFASTPPKAITGLEYDGSMQYLVTAGIPDGNNVYYYRNLYTGEWTTDLPSAKNAGKYTVEYLESKDPETIPDKSKKGTYIRNITIAESDYIPDDAPEPREELVYDGTKQYLVEEVDDWGDERYYFRNEYTGGWTTDRPVGIKPGSYSVEYILAEEMPAAEDEGSFIYGITIARSSSGSGSGSGSGTGGGSGSGSSGSMVFTGIDESEKVLPGTGFSTRIHTPLSIQPDSLSYEQLNMRIQIPTINVDVELAGVPESGDSWAVEWLGDRAGVLSGSQLPGSGYSVVAAHNHLNDTEIGPFGLLFSLEKNDRIFVNTEDGGLIFYSVYANVQLRPDDFEKLSSIAGQEDNSLILITCENEMSDGGYMNRRAVFAKPLF